MPIKQNIEYPHNLRKAAEKVYFKNNLKQLMDSHGVSLNKLCQDSGISINTLREAKNNPSHNLNLDTAARIAETLDCHIKDLIEEDMATLLFEDVSKKHHQDPLFINEQIFSPTNSKLLKDLFLELGIACDISPYSLYQKVMIKNKDEKSSIIIDLNMSINQRAELHVRDFYISVNQRILDERKIKEAVIFALETYAKKLKCTQIQFRVSNDLEPMEDNVYTNILTLPSDFRFTMGTDPAIFIENTYVELHIPFSSEDKTVWYKNFL
ncbi:helix-turn-helix transcriptional regulator [Rossellomorea aquimaris]|uniref:Helix-turn-helix transcriptional regulator n=1 Tax=Rossellomorea aquimaris TaxID=189382 RepID=A0A5D4UME2_9BACI|nr:helix-turn-helix transcriptional regulator [Rossellomorea aquimaris]TYS81705.1 helix-turn-helix transcriptional regulator [Rossellomorea aquimaris]TYS88330.1 helix-turn-helix transcriptional regulator [Rossellomorea aquimaris]